MIQGKRWVTIVQWRHNQLYKKGHIPDTMWTWIYYKLMGKIKFFCVNTMWWSHNIYLEYFTIFNGPEDSWETQSVLIIIFNLVEEYQTTVFKIFHLNIFYKYLFRRGVGPSTRIRIYKKCNNHYYLLWYFTYAQAYKR